MLTDGKWSGAWYPVQAKDEGGRFLRQTSSFRNWIMPDGRPGPTGEEARGLLGLEGPHPTAA